MLGGDRPTARSKRLVDREFDAAPGLGAVIADARDHVQVPVAQVAEDHAGVLGPFLGEIGLHLRDVAFHVLERQGHVEGEDRPVLQHLPHVVADRPHLVALALALGEDGIDHEAFLERTFERRLEAGGIVFLVCPHRLDQDVIGIVLRQRRRVRRRVRRQQLVEVLPHALERGQRAGEAAVHVGEERGQLVKTLHGNDGGVLAVRLAAQAKDGARDDAKRAFRADEDMLQVVARIVLDHFAERGEHRPVGQHGFETQDHVAHHAVADDAIAAGVRRDVAADGGGTARAQIERQHEAVLLDFFLHGLEHSAGLDGDGARHLVDLDDLVHALQRQGQFAVLDLAAFHEPGHAAPGDERLARRVAELEDLGDLGRVGRAQHRFRRAHLAPAGGCLGLRVLAFEDAVLAEQFLELAHEFTHGGPP